MSSSTKETPDTSIGILRSPAEPKSTTSYRPEGRKSTLLWTKVRLSIHLFADWVNVAKDIKEIESKKEPLVASIVQLNQRFKKWYENIGGAKAGVDSLDQRLKNASHIRDVLLELLAALASNLEEGQFGFRNLIIAWFLSWILPTVTAFFYMVYLRQLTYYPAIEYTRQNAETPTSTEPENTSYAELEFRFSKPRLYRLRDTISTLISSLLRLTISIQTPAPFDIYNKSMSIDVSKHTQGDLEGIEGHFPNILDYLKQRILESTLQRRRILQYNKAEHENKASDLLSEDSSNEGSDYDPQEDDDEDATPELEEPTDQSEWQAILESQAHDYEADASSMTSYGSTDSQSGEARPRVPSPPPQARLEDDIYECPYCFSLVDASSRYQWK
jgi:hypothetical protein